MKDRGSPRTSPSPASGESFQRASAIADTASAELLYFTCEFEERIYAGWYRFIPGAKIEVFARGHVKSMECGDAVFPHDLACELLKDIVRETRGVISDEDWPGFPIRHS